MNIDINDNLLEKARQLSGVKDDSALVNAALRLFVTLENQKKLIDFYGKVEIDYEAFK